jgi:hypothetical protein
MAGFGKISRRTFSVAAVGTAIGLAVAPRELAAQSASNEMTQSLGPLQPVRLEPDAVAYLMADDASRSSGLKVKLDDGRPEVIKRFWVEDWRTPEQEFSWEVDAIKAGRYEVTLMVSAPAGSVLHLDGPKNSIELTTSQPAKGGYAWDRITPPDPLDLSRGKNSIRIRLIKLAESGRQGAALKSLELLHVDAARRQSKRISAFKSDTTWLNLAKFGFMCQCGEWSYPRHGPHKQWPAMVDGFNVEAFADMVQSTGAGYALWSATWATYYFPAPIQAIDRILPGHTSARDLIGEIADALHKRGIRLMLYYHLGHDPRPENGGWWQHNWVSQYDKRLLFDHWCAIMTEVGLRYGDRLAGWLYDDELIYYPAPYERLGKAAKAGSSKRIIAYNSWIQARGTDFQDFQFGEGYRGGTELPISANGIWPSGPQKGLHAHGNFQLDEPDWGISKAETVISAPRVDAQRAQALALTAAERDIALSWNLLMYDDGSVSQESLAVLQSAGKMVRQKYPLPRAGS